MLPSVLRMIVLMKQSKMSFLEEKTGFSPLLISKYAPIEGEKKRVPHEAGIGRYQI